MNSSLFLKKRKKSTPKHMVCVCWGREVVNIPAMMTKKNDANMERASYTGENYAHEALFSPPSKVSHLFAR